jgi:deoxyribose-phosphate aldolase
MPRGEVAQRVLGLIDLTDLSDDCTPHAIDALCLRAVGPCGSVAAVCVWPKFVEQARRELDATTVRVATVVNFPTGRDEIIDTVALTKRSLDDGAHEIDLVLPYHNVMINDFEKAETMVRSVATLVHDRSALLKVILETGELADAEHIRLSAQMAIAGGADFIKTSTGKTPVSATPEAVEVMLQVITDSGRPVGIKPSGGIRTVEDAALYLDLADRIMGPAWVSPTTFRFGASGLLDAVEAEIQGSGSTTGSGESAVY